MANEKPKNEPDSAIYKKIMDSGPERISRREVLIEQERIGRDFMPRFMAALMRDRRKRKEQNNED